MSAPHPTEPQDPGVVTLEITAWAAGGRGVARREGRVVLVSGGVPGDRVLVRISRDHGRWLEGRALRLLEGSPRRRPSPCGLQADCGGCPLMPVPEEDQREAKRRFVADALSRIGHLPGAAVEAVVAGPAALGYRNKVELAFGRSREGRLLLGYHRADDPRGLVDVRSCPVAGPMLARALDCAGAFFRGADVEGDRRLTPGGDPVRLVLRCSETHSEVLLALRGGEGLEDLAAGLARRAEAELDGLAGVVLVVPRGGRRGGSSARVFSGRGVLRERLLGIDFDVPAATFFQVNTPAAERLARHVVEDAGACDRVVELYAGAGAIGLALARGGARVELVEADGEAVDCGREAAARAGIAGARFLRGDAGGILAGFPRRGGAVDLLIADPPRTGLGRGVAEGIAALAPGRVAMISCDPATLARDLAALVRLGLRVERVVPFDFFPQTAHVEAVAWLAGPPRRASEAPPIVPREPFAKGGAEE